MIVRGERHHGTAYVRVESDAPQHNVRGWTLPACSATSKIVASRAGLGAKSSAGRCASDHAGRAAAVRGRRPGDGSERTRLCRAGPLGPRHCRHARDWQPMRKPGARVGGGAQEGSRDAMFKRRESDELVAVAQRIVAASRWGEATSGTGRSASSQSSATRMSVSHSAVNCLVAIRASWPVEVGIPVRCEPKHDANLGEIQNREERPGTGFPATITLRLPNNHCFIHVHHLLVAEACCRSRNVRHAWSRGCRRADGVVPATSPRWASCRHRASEIPSRGACLGSRQPADTVA